MNEEFLHYIWKFSLFELSNLKTTDGEYIEIIKPGEHNLDSGPDFFNAKIKIGTTEWAGNVEIHILSSDWDKHFHSKDKAYDNILLHVVYQDDKPVLRNTKNPIPTLILKNRIPQKLIEKYDSFKNNNKQIPCENSLQRVPEIIKSTWLERMLVERLEDKSKVIIDALKLNHSNWEETFYQQLARTFGFKINAVPFELLAKSLPNALLAKHKNSVLQIEAMLFGNAGFLEVQLNDKYMLHLQNEYQFLRKKFSLKPIEAHLWKFLRLRPANFPTIRIAQFAVLIHQSQHLFSKVLEAETLESTRKLLQASVSSYWQTHYMPDKLSNKKIKALGKIACDTIIINTIAPFLFVYGKQKKQAQFVERAFHFLENTKAEENSIVAHFRSNNFNLTNAHATQAVIQLKNNYCAAKLCLHCSIGNYLLKN